MRVRASRLAGLKAGEHLSMTMQREGATNGVILRRSAGLGRRSLEGVPSMIDSLEVQVLYPA